MKRVWLYCENGLFLEANSFGASGTSVGEIVFNTSLTGYQEIVTDPSYAGQFVTFTMPEIGNVGVNAQDMESRGAFAKGIIVRNYHARYSNFRAERSLDALLEEFGVMGICDIDTRYLTKMIRTEGAMMMIASTEVSDPKVLAKMLAKAPRIEAINYIEQVSTKASYRHQNGAYDLDTFEYSVPSATPKAKIVAIDFGVKRNILNELTAVGIEVEVVPNTFDVVALIARYERGELQGVFLSNGPGDPLVLTQEVAKIRQLIAKKIPIFGICLGHQLLSIAHGFDTFKLKFGHHGGNHPVRNVETGLVEITAQNHNYNVPPEIVSVARVTHINLFDNTIEGLVYNDAPVFSVQHHPESSPGPHESRYIFKSFLDALTKN
ncbi:MAG: carbamoyl phosphate synthase small subunit [Sulfuricurvum sp. PC08-66]|nr:MAG: carbamoyl phosphate synthase small subunit [Sulfuricurvum sp. PC08-66]